LESEDGTAAAATGSGRDSISRRKLSKLKAQQPLWDMMRRFESWLSARNGDNSAVQSVEARRRKALFGLTTSGVPAGIGSRMEESDIGIGMHKTSLNELLIRTDGYEVSSRVSNGCHRLIDSLETVGILQEDGLQSSLTTIASITPGSIWKDDGSCGPSDASFRRRLHFQKENALFTYLQGEMSSFMGGGSLGVTSGPGASTSGKLLSVKERLAQNSSTVNTNIATSSSQSTPVWLQGLISLLPTTNGRRGAKAPPHMIEMALSALRDAKLPAVRPLDQNGNSVTVPTTASTTDLNNNDNTNDTTATNLGKRGRQQQQDGDSSDEEAETQNGGYSGQFRQRQRQRIMQSLR